LSIFRHGIGMTRCCADQPGRWRLSLLQRNKMRSDPRIEKIMPAG
jgi:hypothetical protein